MRRLFTLFTLIAVAFGFANATKYTVSEMSGLQTTNCDFTVTFGKYSLELKKVGGQTAPVYNASFKDLRSYANNTLKLTTTGDAFNKVVFYISTAGQKRLTDITASTGTVNVDETNWLVTWTGDAGVKEVTFTVGEKATHGTDGAAKAGQLDFDYLEVVEGQGGGETSVVDPVFSVPAGTYYCAQNVELRCGTSGATIYYTTDGSTPTAASAAYSDPIAVSASVTIKALAVKDGKQSNVVEAAYVVGAATPVANIAAYQGTADDTWVQFGNPVNVLAQNGNSLYVKDNSGYGYIYGAINKTYKNGDEIPAGFVGKKVTYNGQPELQSNQYDNFQAASGNTPIEPVVATTADITAANFGHYVVIKNAHVMYGSKTISDAAGTAQVRTGMGGYGSSTDSTKVYDVIAIIGSTKMGESAVPCALPVKLTDAGGDEPVDGITIAEFQALADNATATFKDPVTVLASYNGRTFVKDETGYMLIYGNTGKTYVQGNVIPAGFSGTKTTYDGEPELKTPFSGFKDASSTVLVTPEELTAASTLAHANFGHYVVAKNVTFNADGTITLSNNETVKYYNNLGANIPSDLTKKYDVYGIIGSYGKTNTIYQLLTMQVTVAGGGEVDVPDVANVEELFGKQKGTNARITGELTAIYQYGPNLYVKSEDIYTLVYGSLPNTFSNGDIITNAVASWTTYNNAKQLTPVADTWVSTKTGTPVEPTEMALEEIGTDMVHNYLLVKDVAIEATETENTYLVSDETLEGVKMFNKFVNDVTVPEALEGKTFDLTCFVTVFQDAVELYPVVIKGQAPEYPAGDVNGDGVVDIADVNACINVILGAEEAAKYEGRADVNKDGSVDIADVNAIINIILGV